MKKFLFSLLVLSISINAFAIDIDLGEHANRRDTSRLSGAITRALNTQKLKNGVGERLYGQMTKVILTKVEKAAYGALNLYLSPEFDLSGNTEDEAGTCGGNIKVVLYRTGKIDVRPAMEQGAGEPNVFVMCWI